MIIVTVLVPFYPFYGLLLAPYLARYLARCLRWARQHPDLCTFCVALIVVSGFAMADWLTPEAERPVLTISSAPSILVTSYVDAISSRVSCTP